ncbi:hypothetical protein [Kitasatospora sp. NBC_00315]|uniref:hypothetical protein n=1 Tax=Kitasatospora sp. NBC_00315 TaxID=2975963 RepID=UPI003243BBD9
MSEPDIRAAATRFTNPGGPDRRVLCPVIVSLVWVAVTDGAPGTGTTIRRTWSAAFLTVQTQVTSFAPDASAAVSRTASESAQFPGNPRVSTPVAPGAMLGLAQVPCAVTVWPVPPGVA